MNGFVELDETRFYTLQVLHCAALLNRQMGGVHGFVLAFRVDEMDLLFFAILGDLEVVLFLAEEGCLVALKEVGACPDCSWASK